MTSDMFKKLAIDRKRLDEINSFLMDPNNKTITEFIEIVEKYGGPEKINQKAREAGRIENLMGRLKKKNSQYYEDLQWLIEQKNKGSFITIDEYRKKIFQEEIHKKCTGSRSRFYNHSAPCSGRVWFYATIR